MNRRNTEIRRMGKTRKTREHSPLTPSLPHSLPPPLPISLALTLFLKPWNQILQKCSHYKNTKGYFNHTFRLSQLHHCDQEMLFSVEELLQLRQLATLFLHKICLATFLAFRPQPFNQGTQGSFIDQRSIDSYASCKVVATNLTKEGSILMVK